MTYSMTVRLDDETERRLSELAEHQASRSAAVAEAIRLAWQRLQEEKLDSAYAAAVAENPHYPYESAAERTAIRRRRNARETGDQ